MFPRTKEDKITDVGFQTDGCRPTIACGSKTEQLALNKSLAHALATVSADGILKRLGGLTASELTVHKSLPRHSSGHLPIISIRKNPPGENTTGEIEFKSVWSR